MSRPGRRSRSRRLARRQGQSDGADHANRDRPGAEHYDTDRRAQLRFGLTFLAVAAVLFSIYSFPYLEAGTPARWFHRYLSGYASLAGSVLGIFDRNLSVTNNVITGRMTLEIVKSCDAMEANLLFIAAIVAWPAGWQRKLVAGSVGLVILVVVNVVRICTLYFLGVFAPSMFELFHIELWPLLIVVIACADFAVWTMWMRRPARESRG